MSDIVRTQINVPRDLWAKLRMRALEEKVKVEVVYQKILREALDVEGADQ